MSRTRSVRCRSFPRLEKLEARDVPSFLPPSRYTLAAGGEGAVVADFNGDQNNDVAVSLLYVPNISIAVLLGDGTGSLGAPTYFDAGANPRAIAAADFNADGKTDLAAIADGGVSVCLGNGDGTFQTCKQFLLGTTGAGGYDLAFGDINGDGRLDLATSNLSSGEAPDSVSVLYGNGDGSFQPAIVHAVGWGGAIGIAVGDLDGDGLDDITVDAYWGHDLHVLYGNGAYLVYTLNAPVGNTQADVDADGDLDVMSGQLGNNVGVMLNRGDGTFFSPSYYKAAYNSYFPDSGDVNKDGKIDVVMANGSAPTVTWILGNGDGTFKPHESLSMGEAGGHLQVADLTKDGFADLVVPSTSGVTVLINDKKWSKPRPPFGPLSNNPVGPPVVPIPPPPGPSPHQRREITAEFADRNNLSVTSPHRHLSAMRHVIDVGFEWLEGSITGSLADSAPR